jgi:hypothetical protein
MSRTGEIYEVPQKFDEEGNPITVEEGSKTGASDALTLENRMKRLEKLTAKNNKLRRKIKVRRIKGGSSSSEEDYSNEEDVSKKGKKGINNYDKSSYNSMSFNYDSMSSTTAYTSMPVGKAPYFDETCYN